MSTLFAAYGISTKHLTDLHAHTYIHTYMYTTYTYCVAAIGLKSIKTAKRLTSPLGPLLYYYLHQVYYIYDQATKVFKVLKSRKRLRILLLSPISITEFFLNENRKKKKTSFREKETVTAYRIIPYVICLQAIYMAYCAFGRF